MTHLISPAVCGAARQWRSLCLRVPTDCPMCGGGSHGGLLCGGCSETARIVADVGQVRCARCALRCAASAPCPDCARRTPAFHRVIAACDYEGPWRGLVGQFKAGHRFWLAPGLARLMAQAVRDDRAQAVAGGMAGGGLVRLADVAAEDGGLPCDPVRLVDAGWSGIAGRMAGLPQMVTLVPVPARRASIRQRGFNPAAELTRFLARELDVAVQPSLLLRQREGGRQTHAARRVRLDAGRHDFRCGMSLNGGVYAVVDDVMTTGSTLHHAARCLLEAGAEQVWGLVLARTPWQGRAPLR